MGGGKLVPTFCDIIKERFEERLNQESKKASNDLDLAQRLIDQRIASPELIDEALGTNFNISHVSLCEMTISPVDLSPNPTKAPIDALIVSHFDKSFLDKFEIIPIKVDNDGTLHVVTCQDSPIDDEKVKEILEEAEQIWKPSEILSNLPSITKFAQHICNNRSWEKFILEFPFW
jgi:hypothetical protein